MIINSLLYSVVLRSTLLLHLGIAFVFQRSGKLCSKLLLTRMHSSRTHTTRSLPYRRTLSRGSLPRRVSVQGIYIQGGLCLEGQRPWTETPKKKQGTRDTDSLEETWDQRQRPPGRNMRPGSETGSDIIQKFPL